MKSEQLLYRSEGFVQEAVGSMIMLIVGVGVAVLVLIFVGALGGQTYNIVEPNLELIGHTDVTMQPFLISNGSSENLGFPNIHSGSLTIQNDSAVIKITNFTIDYTEGRALFITDVVYNGSLWNGTTGYANYTHGLAEIRTSVQGSITSGFSALEQSGDYLPIIVLAVVIALVLTLILGFTAFANLGGGAGGQSAL